MGQVTINEHIRNAFIGGKEASGITPLENKKEILLYSTKKI